MPSKKQEAKTRTLENCIVALGASAGGLEALQAFFRTADGYGYSICGDTTSFSGL